MSEKNQHTPGPWFVLNGWDENGEGSYFPSVTFKKYGVVGDRTGTLHLPAITVNASHDQKAVSIMANARLIAAAPELYDIVYELANLTDAQVFSNEKAIELINKINGK